MPIPQDKMEQWISELRNPKNKQGKGVLASIEADGVHYCCLGLFCEKIEKMEGRIEYDEVEKKDVIRYGDNTETLPSVIRGKYGVSGNGYTRLKDKFNDEMMLSQLNDEGFTFSQIADILEHFEVL